MKYSLSLFFILYGLFLLFLIHYKINSNLIYLANISIDFLKDKEDHDFIITGLKLIAKHSKTKEEFILNLQKWAKKAKIKYEYENVFLINNSFLFYSNKSLFNNNLKIYYNGKEYTFKKIEK